MRITAPEHRALISAMRILLEGGDPATVAPRAFVAFCEQANCLAGEIWLQDPTESRFTWRREGIVDIAGQPLSLSVQIALNGQEIGGISVFGDEDLEGLAESINLMSLQIAQLVRLKRHEVPREDSLESQIEHQTHELRLAIEELDTLSYSVSHDLRAPLRAMNAYAMALKEDYGDKIDAGGREYLDRIRVASNRMASLIDDLLSLASVGRAIMSPSEVDLSRMSASIVSDIQAANPALHADVNIQPNMRVRGDAHLLETALTNLIQNAFKFSSKEQHAKIDIGSIEGSQGLCFFIRDNGAGFDARYIDKLFKPFNRLHAERDYSGTGIGLAIVKKVIDRHRGEVWGESQPGAGATFWFRLGKT